MAAAQLKLIVVWATLLMYTRSTPLIIIILPTLRRLRTLPSLALWNEPTQRPSIIGLLRWPPVSRRTRVFLSLGWKNGVPVLPNLRWTRIIKLLCL